MPSLRWSKKHSAARQGSADVAWELRRANLFATCRLSGEYEKTLLFLCRGAARSEFDAPLL